MRPEVRSSAKGQGAVEATLHDRLQVSRRRLLPMVRRLNIRVLNRGVIFPLPSSSELCNPPAAEQRGEVKPMS